MIQIHDPAKMVESRVDHHCSKQGESPAGDAQAAAAVVNALAQYGKKGGTRSVHHRRAEAADDPDHQAGLGQTVEIVDVLDHGKSRSDRRAVDGGIDETSASGVVSAGADVLVIGQAIFRQNDIAGAVRQLRMSLQA